MIYILAGSDTKKISLYLKNLAKGQDIIRIDQKEVSREQILEYGYSNDLFGNTSLIVLVNVINEGGISLQAKDLLIMQESVNTFVFVEDRLKAVDEKKYKKFAIIESFEEKKSVQNPKINTFAIVDSFARRDKVATWVLYCEAIEKGTEPEALSGLLFWKIKTMILNGNRLFTKDELKHQSSSIVSLYHKSHRGECDFSIGLEQFILNSLSK